MSDRVRSSEVTLGQAARASIEHYGINESELRLARALSICHETPEYLIAKARLPDGRPIQMRCAHDNPAHIIDLRLI